MNTVARNVICFVAIAAAWVFFFVPNPLLNVLNVQGLEYRLGSLGLFVLVPIALAIVSMFLTTGVVSARLALTLLVPVLGAATCWLLWLFSVYLSTEELLGAWLYCLTPIVPYIVGVLVATLLLRRSKKDSESVLPQPPIR
jgi:hypothetical protein